MTPETFDRLVAQGYNRIPVVREILADLDTPLSVYMKLAGRPYSYLLESVQGGEKWGRYSFIGLPARQVVRVQGREVCLEEDGRVVEQARVEDPLEWLEAFRARFRVPDLPHLPRFSGGLVGYFGYDTIRYIEPRLADGDKPDPLGVPDILLMVSDELVAYDNLAGRLYLVVHAAPDGYDKARERLDALEAGLRRPTELPPAEA
ncbi:MAG: anthranilate synthase component I, partial [Ectothiorhodospira sp.]